MESRSQSEQTLGSSEVKIRRVQVADAAAVVSIKARVVAESAFHVADSADTTKTVAEQAQYIAAIVTDPERFMIVAEVGGDVVGVLEIEREVRKRLRHRAEVWTHVLDTHRGKRVGLALAEAALAWARATPSIEKLVMHILHTNEASLALTRKCGFVEEGRLIDEVKVAPGVYVDLVLMGGRLRPRASS
jgi:RimJ/RimL family protein N-acetyltransferase